MGRKARQRQREAGLRKMPNDPKRPFVEAQVRKLQAMDADLQRIIDKDKLQPADPELLALLEDS